jgi:enoyl-CoA hydratase
MSYQHLQTSLSSHILTVSISRAAAMNALNQEVMAELRQLLQAVITDTEIRAVIMTGEGEKAFVAGADIKELSALNALQAQALAEAGQQLFMAIENLPKPVVAVVNGFALGGGCELAMACHMRIATQTARFGQPEVSLGIIPGYGGTQRLPQLVGRGKALELLLTGDTITAAQALQIGLVNHVADSKTEALELAAAMLQRILQKGPVAVAHVIKSVNAGYAFETAGYATEAESFGACAGTADFKEGTSAFIEKRPAQFSGK